MYLVFVKGKHNRAILFACYINKNASKQCYGDKLVLSISARSVMN